MFKITGVIHKIGDTVPVNDKFKKRELVLFLLNESKPEYSDYVSFEAKQGDVDKLEPLSAGDKVEVEFFVNGRKYEKEGQDEKYFNTLSIKSVVVLEMARSASAAVLPPKTIPPGSVAPPAPAEVNDQLPF